MAKTAKSSVKNSKAQSAEVSEAVSAMDYPEHERTYDLFLWLSKWTIIACIALLVAMAFGFYGGGGLIGGTLLLIILMVAAVFVM